MIFFTSPAPCIIFALIIALHFLTLRFDKWLSVAMLSVNICLHTALTAVLLYLGASLGELTLTYAVSLIIYLLISYPLHLCRRGEGERREKDDV